MSLAARPTSTSRPRARSSMPASACRPIARRAPCPRATARCWPSSTAGSPRTDPLDRQLVAAADVADDLAQMRLGLDERAAIGEQARQQRAVALQQLVGELDHARVRPAVLAQLEQAQERRFLLSRRVLG